MYTRNKGVHYLTPFTAESRRFVTMKPKPLPQSVFAYLTIFDWQSWLAIAISVVWGIVLLIVLGRGSRSLDLIAVFLHQASPAQSVQSLENTK